MGSGLKINCISFSREMNILFQDFSLMHPWGQVLVVKGKNGSGKSTLLKLICGFIQAESGYITVDDQINMQYLDKIHYMGHDLGLIPTLSALENIKFFKKIFKKTLLTDDPQHHLKKWELDEVQDLPLHKLSLGQKRRVMLSLITLYSKPIWILDEPLGGLDEKAQKIILESIGNHIHNQGMVILSSHQNVPLSEGKYKILEL
jgi:heme exporter protein A